MDCNKCENLAFKSDIGEHYCLISWTKTLSESHYCKDYEEKIKPVKTNEPNNPKNKWERCKLNDALDEHNCPYSEEITEDSEIVQCNCCADCETKCAEDV